MIKEIFEKGRTWFIIAILIFSSCAVMKNGDQGVNGQIYWLEGNQMPVISEEGDEVRRQKEKVQRTLIICPLVNLGDATMENGLFKSLAAEPIKEIESDKDGAFSIQLEPGAYSIFTKEEDGLFANRFDTDGNIQPVYIKNGEWVELEILIDYKAAY